MNKCQTAFMRGGEHYGWVMCLHEIPHDTKIRKKARVVLKLDFEKAYDKISWGFLFECLKQRGFNENGVDG